MSDEFIRKLRSRIFGPDSEIDRTARPYAEADLTGKSLARQVLCHADFRNSDLRGVDFTGSDLSGAQLAGARLRGTSRPRVLLPIIGVIAINLVFGIRAGTNSLIAFNALVVHLGIAGLFTWFLAYVLIRGKTIFQDANLSGTILQGATYDRTTQWPVGFDPDDRRAIAIQT